MLKTVFAALAMLSACCLPGQASAQGLFDFLFGRAPARAATSQAPQPIARSSSPAFAVRPQAPNRAVVHGSAASHRSVTYCVRLCDGRFFPLQRHRGATPAQLCNAHCPAAQTKIFSGGNISRAMASDGTRYSKLENAFVYRDRIVPSCTCNGRSHFGLARVDIPADPTLRAGDIVVTADGLVVAGRKPAANPAKSVPVVSGRTRPSDIRQALAPQERTQVSQ